MSKSSGLRPPNNSSNNQDRLSTASGDHRFSGIGAGFMNGDISDSDSDDDDSTTDHHFRRQPPPGVSSPSANSRPLTPAAALVHQPAPASAASKNLAALADLATSPPTAPKPVHAIGNGGQNAPRALNLTGGNNMMDAMPSPRPLQQQIMTPRDKVYPDEKKSGWDAVSPLATPAPPYLPLNRAEKGGHPQQMQMQSPHHIAFPGPQTPLTPSSPYPLMSPGGPIVPAFSKPANSPSDSTTFKADSEKIMRGIGEERILPKRGDRGDDFWRRFSIVAKEDKKANQKPSSWLNKTMHGSAILNRSFLILSILFLVGLVGGIFCGWYFSHNKPGNTRPESVGGVDQHGQTSLAVSSTTKGLHPTSSGLHVDPQGTVARRAPAATAAPIMKRTRSKRHSAGQHH